MSKARFSIDLHYFLGDALMTTGAALAVFLTAIVVLTPFRLGELPPQAQGPYAAVLAVAGVGAVALTLAGQHMRRSAAALDRS